MRIGIIGDIMLGDQPVKTGFGLYSKYKGNYHKLFERVLRWMKSFDFIIGNFEGVLVDKIGEISPNKSSMKVPLEALIHLKDLKIKVLSIANNHTMEYGPGNFHRMCNLLANNGFITVGHKNKPYEIITHNNSNIGILGFSTIPAFYGHKPEYYFLDYSKEDRINELLIHLKQAKDQCDYLIVFPHWGYEFIDVPSKCQLELAKQLTSFGANVIVGAHPHVIQKGFIINQKPVVFSAGNFISDYWQGRIRKSLLVEVNVESEHVVLYTLHVDRDFIITKTSTNRLFDGDVECLDSETELLGVVNRERNRVRKEVVFHLLANGLDLIRNYKVVFWLLGRFVFILKHRKKLKQDPLQIYNQRLTAKPEV